VSELEVVIMVDVLIGEMVGSDWRFTRKITTEPWNGIWRFSKH